LFDLKSLFKARKAEEPKQETTQLAINPRTLPRGQLSQESSDVGNMVNRLFKRSEISVGSGTLDTR
jgi:hypothetical protein